MPHMESREHAVENMSEGAGVISKSALMKNNIKNGFQSGLSPKGLKKGNNQS